MGKFVNYTENAQGSQALIYLRARTKCKENRDSKAAKAFYHKIRRNIANWPPFWDKFEAEIDKTELVSVTRFAYLQELLEPKTGIDIDGLPLNIEGYEKAKKT